MKSMTGYGSAERSSKSAIRVNAEAFSFNKKNLDVKIILPPDLLRLEPKIRKLATGKIFRGMLTLKISLGTSDRSKTQFKTISDYYNKLEKIKENLEIKTAVTITDLLNAQDFFDKNEEFDFCGDENLICATASDAIAKLLEMRKTEGLVLQKEIGKSISKITEMLAEIENKNLNAPNDYKEKLLARLKNLGLEINLTDERLLKEVAIFADKSDISEETARLRSHIQQFNSAVSAKEEPVGKTLDFIIQEIQREINTLSAKNPLVELSPTIIRFKCEAEKIREQVQNIE
jgi:uncharacterized protein (TIGR00255 family)